jgi:hypothetical protein
MNPTRHVQPAAPRAARTLDQRWAALRAKIAAHAPLLATQGVLVRKPLGAGRFWYLRFLLPADATGRRRQTSLYIGKESDAELVAGTRQLLEAYRQPRRWVEEVAACAAFAGSLKALLRHYAREGSRTGRESCR